MFKVVRLKSILIAAVALLLAAAIAVGVVFGVRAEKRKRRSLPCPSRPS